ncbi:MAG: hypothetical protein ABMB14_11850 [Myxococcota bacterium]
MVLELWIGVAASAADPAPAHPPVEPQVAPSPEPVPETAEHRLARIEAELAALKAQLAQAEQDAILREAEALAAGAPPPPQPAPSSPSAFNPAITAFGDVLTTVGIRDGEVVPGSGPWIRSLELDLRADVDPFAKAVAVFAVEQEPPDLAPAPTATISAATISGATGPADDAPEFSAAPEELYVDFVAFPAGLSLRVGGFRQPFGVTNRAHPHDYPWPDTPLPLVALLGEEGLNDVGGLVSWHVPNPWGKGITLEAGANAGSRFDPDGETALPAWIGRAEYFDHVGNVDVGIGGSATGIDGDPVVGGDLMIRWRANSWRSVVLLGEVLSDTTSTGGYASLQVQPTRPLYLGARFDLLDDQWQAGGYASWYTSEFLRVRAGVMTDADALLTTNLQLTFVWGSHPVEPYWVNR